MENKKIALEGFEFVWVFGIEPIMVDDENIYQYTAYENFNNHRDLKLHRYGKGPFCKFFVPKRWKGIRGVYLFLVNSNLKYIGECEDLESRFNTGYGNISPRNCYEGGQQTNCRINHLILEAAMKESEISIFFLETQNHKRIEERLRYSLKPPWNRI